MYQMYNILDSLTMLCILTCPLHSPYPPVQQSLLYSQHLSIIYTVIVSQLNAKYNLCFNMYLTFQINASPKNTKTKARNYVFVYVETLDSIVVFTPSSAPSFLHISFVLVQSSGVFDYSASSSFFHFQLQCCYSSLQHRCLRPLPESHHVI